MLKPSQVERLNDEAVLLEGALDRALADAGSTHPNKAALRVLWEQYAQGLERTLRVARELQTWNTDPPPAT